MRFLITCIPGLGHLNPLLPIAFALKKAGHEVAIATAPIFCKTVTNVGLECIPAGLDWDERRLLETIPELRAITPIYRGEWMMNNIFLNRSPHKMISDLSRIVPEWRPDMIVSGSFEYGGAVVAEKLGLPYATASYTIRWNPWILKHAIGRAITRLRAENGLPADPELRMFGRHLDLCLAPPSWAFEAALLRPALTQLVRRKVLGPDLPLQQRLWGLKALALQTIFDRAMRANPKHLTVGSTTRFIGEVVGLDPVPPPPAWLKAMPRQPTVFVSLGTVLSAEYPEIFEKLLTGLRDKSVNLVMTLGGKGDSCRFGRQPPNVRIVKFMTQDELHELLPHVDLSINHAGYSSVMEALLHGVPLVLLPLVSDAPMNTQMCRFSGVTPELPRSVWGLSPKGLPIVRAEKLTPGILTEAAMTALSNPAYRAAARAMQLELAARPGPKEAVRLLQQVARGEVIA